MALNVGRMTEALNEFFQGQAAIEGKCLVDYVQFGTQYDKVYEDKPVAEAEAVFNISGSTALLDAIGRGTTELGAKLKALPEAHRPERVLVVVVTDGYENSSREWGAVGVKALIKQQEETYKWDYVFLGANIDAVAVGADFGFQADKSMTFNIHDSGATGATSASLGNYAGTYRSKGAASFSDDDRKKAVGK